MRRHTRKMPPRTAHKRAASKDARRVEIGIFRCWSGRRCRRASGGGMSSVRRRLWARCGRSGSRRCRRQRSRRSFLARRVSQGSVTGSFARPLTLCNCSSLIRRNARARGRGGISYAGPGLPWGRITRPLPRRGHPSKWSTLSRSTGSRGPSSAISISPHTSCDRQVMAF